MMVLRVLRVPNLLVRGGASPRAAVLRSTWAIALAALLVPVSTASLAHAKRKAAPAPAAAEQAGLSLEEISVMLSSSQPDEVRMAIESSALLGTADAVPLLSERIRAGLPADLLLAALDALSVLNRPESSELLVTLSRHRRPAVRLRSVQALSGLRAKSAEPALVVALGDASSEVREAAAEGLGQLGAVQNLDPLFLAFDRGVVSAGRAIAKLVTDAQVPRVMEALGRVPFSSLTPVFDTLLARRDISESTKLSVLGALAELGTAEARAYFENLKQKLPADASPRIRKTVDDAVVRIAK
jgi:HEAT repeat protein